MHLLSTIIDYTYPYSDVPEPYYYDEIQMFGSTATAWAPPVIDSVSPGTPDNPWVAGAATTFIINGEGFGYSPSVTLSGGGITSFTYACPAGPEPDKSCDTQIVGTVTIDASTPAETVGITVTAGGQNPSGFLPVQTSGQQGQATAQANTSAAPVVQILFNGKNIANNGAANPALVVVGQQIALTASVTVSGSPITPDSQKWSRPPGTVIANFVASNKSGTVVPLPNPNGTPTDCPAAPFRAHAV